ncbi:hypothetical protein ACCW94_16330 [Enterobacter soli]|uniref:hypothetical protein n=1 Tax=Enterobacter soli TaxID=885040 RepID=UPI003EDB3AEC
MSSGSLPSDALLADVYFRVMQLYEIVRPTATTPTALDDIKKQLGSSSLDLLTLFAIERELITLCPDQMVGPLYQNAQNKLSRILPTESVTRLDTLDKSLPPPDNIVNQRIKLVTASGWLHEYYFFSSMREKFISKNKLNFIIIFTLLFFITLFSAIYCQLYITDREGVQFSLVIGMACAGYLGATISIVRRFKEVADSPIDGIDREGMLMKLEEGQKGIYLSLLLGTISPFIIMLFLWIIPSGDNTVVLGINLLPHFNTPVIKPTATIADIYLYTQTQNIADIARILIISILSGFSERLVPDVLDRLTSEVQKKYNSKP